MLRTIVLVMLLMVGCFLPVHASSIASDDIASCHLKERFKEYRQLLLSPTEMGRSFDFFDHEWLVKYYERVGVKGDKNKVISIINSAKIDMATQVLQIKKINNYYERCSKDSAALVLDIDSFNGRFKSFWMTFEPVNGKWMIISVMMDIVKAKERGYEGKYKKWSE